ALPGDPVEPGALATDRRRGTVTREDCDRVVEASKPVERVDHRVGVATGQVDPAERAGKERVAAEEQALVGPEQADRALGVARGVEHLETEAAEANLATLRKVDGWNRRRDVERRPGRPRMR